MPASLCNANGGVFVNVVRQYLAGWLRSVACSVEPRSRIEPPTSRVSGRLSSARVVIIGQGGVGGGAGGSTSFGGFLSGGGGAPWSP